MKLADIKHLSPLRDGYWQAQDGHIFWVTRDDTLPLAEIEQGVCSTSEEQQSLMRLIAAAPLMLKFFAELAHLDGLPTIEMRRLFYRIMGENEALKNVPRIEGASEPEQPLIASYAAVNASIDAWGTENEISTQSVTD
ncbi:MAG: hypothetical protein JNM52_00210 [Betaproteobacteria bacterium]|nr:hypothetical protein [Betaproteobacteria bacterium]